MPKTKLPKWLRKLKRKQIRCSKDWRAYQHRKQALAELGFASYAEYLASPLWQGIRTRHLTANPLCVCCKRAAQAVHHDTYYKRLLEGEAEAVGRDLYSVCHGCHRTIEFDGAEKRSAGSALRQFRSMLYFARHGKSKATMIRERRHAIFVEVLAQCLICKHHEHQEVKRSKLHHVVCKRCGKKAEVLKINGQPA